MSDAHTPYLPHPPHTRQGALTLVCLPCAGGGASAFAGWQRRLDGHGVRVQVCPVQLPGREERLGDARFTELDAMVAELDAHLAPVLSGPHILYGHSMGAFLAHALTLARRRRGAPLPQALVLCSHRAPHIRPNRILDPASDDAQLAARLVEMGGLSAELARHRGFRRWFLPLVRDDLSLCSGWVAQEEIEPVEVPLHLLVGDQDRLVPRPAMEAWSRHTSRRAELRTMPGGHFFVRTRENDLLAWLAGILARYGAGRDAVGTASRAQG